MPRVPLIPPPPAPWRAPLATVPAFVPSVPDAPPRGLRRAARAVAAWVLAPLAAWLVLNAALFP